ncbi:MAG: hypothetical protein WBA16_01625 [Nonlabens sp.]
MQAYIKTNDDLLFENAKFNLNNITIPGYMHINVNQYIDPKVIQYRIKSDEFSIFKDSLFQHIVNMLNADDRKLYKKKNSGIWRGEVKALWIEEIQPRSFKREVATDKIEE